MNTRNLIYIGLTGLLLFAYGFFSNNPDLISERALSLLNFALLTFCSIVVVNLLSLVTVDFWFVRFKGEEASDLVKLLVALMFYAICAVIIFHLLGRNITAIFATSALVSALIGFALQSTLGNFFSGIALQIDQPFQLGDRVSIQDNEGVVISMTWRATTVRTSSNKMIQIPNGLMSEEVVEIIPQDGKVRRWFEFLVLAKFPPQIVIDTVYEAILNRPHRNLNTEKPIRVRMWEYTPTDKELFITYRVLYYPRKYSEGNSHTDRELLRRVWYSLQRQGMGSDKFIGSRKKYRSLISSIEFFQDLSSEAQNVLYKSAESLLFDAGETLDGDNLPEQTMFIVVRGRVNIQKKLSSVSENNELLVFSHRPKSQIPVLLNSELVDMVASHLAEYIGPTAFSLVYEKQSSSLYWLYQQVSDEIPDLYKREEFLKHCPTNPVEQLQSGDCFGEMSLFLGEPLTEVTMNAAVETELLTIPPKAIAKILERDRTALNVLACGFAKYQSEYLTQTIQMPQGKAWEAEDIATFLEEKFNLDYEEDSY